jgi:hypothetical protein
LSANKISTQFQHLFICPLQEKKNLNILQRISLCGEKKVYSCFLHPFTNAHIFNKAFLFFYSSLLSLCNHLGYERQTPHIFFLTDISIHSGTEVVPQKLSSLTIYIDLWQEGKPAPGQNPSVISPPVVIFRRMGVRAGIRTQNPVLANTRLAKTVPLSHLRRHL